MSDVLVNPKLAQAMTILQKAHVPDAIFLNGLLACPPEKLPELLVAYLTAESARTRLLSLALGAKKAEEAQLIRARQLARAAKGGPA